MTIAETIPYTKRKPWLPLRTLKWLSKKLDVDYALLQNIVKESKKSPNSLYQKITVSRNGKKRTIHVPNNDLMEVQKRINKRILASFPRNPNTFGFSGGNIRDAINIHLEAPAIWTCDIKDAFPSMFRERILGALRIYLSESASQMLVLLTTLPFLGRLPQGAPTSPRIFDLCMRLLDREFVKIAESKAGKYSRYADNLFFSGKREDFGEIEKEVFSWFSMAELDLHKVKVRDLNGQTAAKMLGLNVIGRKIHNTRGFKKALRISIHHTNWLLDNGKKDTPEFVKALQKLRGQMNFARTDTLPQKLLNDYLELEKQLK